MPDLKLVGSSKIPALNIPVEEFGTPGARIELHIVPQFENNKLSDADVLGNAARRTFRVSARLSHAPSIIGRINAHFDEKDGDSFLIVPSKMAQLVSTRRMGAFTLSRTMQGSCRLLNSTASRSARRRREANLLTPSIRHSITFLILTTSLYLSS